MTFSLKLIVNSRSKITLTISNPNHKELQRTTSNKTSHMMEIKKDIVSYIFLTADDDHCNLPNHTHYGSQSGFSYTV